MIIIDDDESGERVTVEMGEWSRACKIIDSVLQILVSTLYPPWQSARIGRLGDWLLLVFFRKEGRTLIRGKIWTEIEGFCLFIQNSEWFMVTFSTKYGNENASIMPPILDALLRHMLYLYFASSIQQGLLSSLYSAMIIILLN